MNRHSTTIFVVLGIVFLVLLLIAIGFYTSMSMSGANAPANTQSSARVVGSNSTTTGEGTSNTGSFELSGAQRQALVNLGIDPSIVPTSISAEQEACFVAELGQETVNEIKNGAIPSTMDFFKAKGCI